MPRQSKADFYVSRSYVHEEVIRSEDEEGNEVESVKTTVDRPESDVTARVFEFFASKAARDDGDVPQHSFVADLMTLPAEVLRMLAAIGLNVRLNQQIKPDQTAEENVDNLSELYELLKSGQLREASSAATNYVSTFVIDFARMLELKFDREYTATDALAAIKKASTVYSDDGEFDKWKQEVQSDGFYQQARAERFAANAAKKQAAQAEKETPDPLAGLLEEESETASA